MSTRSLTLPPAPREYDTHDQNIVRSLVERALSSSAIVGAHATQHYDGGDDPLDHGSLPGLGDDDHALYHTDARALTWLGTRSTTDLPEGTNLYYTQARFDSAFSAKSTSDLSEGTNLYFTNERVDDRVAALIQGVAGKLTWTYNDVAGTLTPNIIYDSQYFSGTDWVDLTDGGATTLHSHAALTLPDLEDLDTSVTAPATYVSNDGTSVMPITFGTDGHVLVRRAGVLTAGQLAATDLSDYSSLAVLPVSLTTDVTGNLPLANFTDGPNDAFLTSRAGVQGWYSLLTTDIPDLSGTYLPIDGSVTMTGTLVTLAIRPAVGDTHSSGTPSYRWNTTYTKFLNVSSTSTMADITASGTFSGAAITATGLVTIQRGASVVGIDLDTTGGVSAQSPRLQFTAHDAAGADFVRTMESGGTGVLTFRSHAGASLMHHTNVGTLYPETNGMDLGTTSRRWDGYFEDVTIYGTLTQGTGNWEFEREVHIEGNGLANETYLRMEVLGQTNNPVALHQLDETNDRYWIDTSAAEFRLAVGGNTILYLDSDEVKTLGFSRMFQIISGKTYMWGDAGGWAMGHFARGNAGTDLGGYGFYGTADALNYFYIGTYSTGEIMTLTNPTTIHFKGTSGSDGTIYWGSSTAIGDSYYIEFGGGRAKVGYDGANSHGYGVGLHLTTPAASAKHTLIGAEGAPFMRCTYDTDVVDMFVPLVNANVNERIIYGNSTAQRIQMGSDNTGISAVLGTTQHTDGGVSLDYRAYLAYDCYWDDSAHNWVANRTSLGRKWSLHFGYHNNAFHVRTYDGVVTSPWADSAWTNVFKVDATGKITLDGSGSENEIYASSGNLKLNSTGYTYVGDEELRVRRTTLGEETLARIEIYGQTNNPYMKFMLHEGDNVATIDFFSDIFTLRRQGSTKLYINNSATILYNANLRLPDSSQVYTPTGAGYLALSGGTGSSVGANLVLYGNTHATVANDWRLRKGSTNVFTYDDSAGELKYTAVTATQTYFRLNHATGSTYLLFQENNADKARLQWGTSGVFLLQTNETGAYISVRPGNADECMRSYAENTFWYHKVTSEVYDHGTKTVDSNLNMDLANIHRVTINANNVDITPTNLDDGDSITLVIEWGASAASGFTIVNADWGDNGAPAWSYDSTKADVVVVTKAGSVTFAGTYGTGFANPT